MNTRIAWIAAGTLVLVTAAWWLLSDFASEPVPSAVPEAAQSSVGIAKPEPQPAQQEGDYPSDYVDDLPLDDLPPLPSGVANDYVPTFEMPDLIGDGMLVPVEVNIAGPGPISTEPDLADPSAVPE
jgi:hypothetical protein